ncbi:MAG: aminopeptidase P family protein [Thermogemmatispora sp.]|uniref:M24 family metallopeptidase n=1 Tax=Thermogemmatispora sp. TaxID=1968838 RepID=UPI0019E8F81B|nr:M24 family metallopeptidase [Thermogemmatispora sp.]MBE3565755.1 aminopeptidase P family protein [Thermogemmatispora sp.]
MNLERIQQALQEERLQGWLFYDFRRSNSIAHRILELPREQMFTRRWFYWVPAQGEPIALVSAVEPHVLRSLPGEQRIFRSWQELHAQLRDLFQPGWRIAMEYSPHNAIPYLSLVDAGTIELVRSYGVEIVSSADLAQHFVARLTPQQIASHREAGRRLIAAKDRLLEELTSDLQAGRTLNEYSVQQRFLALMRAQGLLVEEPPLIAVNGNAGNPHYAPTAEHHSPIRQGDLLLIDFWARLPEPEAIYADYTWMAFVGRQDDIPSRQREVFALVCQARDAGLDFIRQRLATTQPLQAYEVDDVVRTVIARAGYGEAFVHRSGHSITTAEHGEGAHLDNLETHDERRLLPGTCCSLEPGIYLPDFGVRSEINLLIHEREVEVTGVPMQYEIVPLL